MSKSNVKTINITMHITILLLIQILLSPHILQASVRTTGATNTTFTTKNQGLYSADDHVKILTGSTFKWQVLHSPQAWFVEFYNSYCGYCQRFAVSWKALASNVKEWSDLVTIAAIDCSVEENAEVCSDHDIKRIPELRYFHEGYNKGLGATIQKCDDVMCLKESLLEHILNEVKEGRGTQFPPMFNYELNDLDQLLYNNFTGVEYIFVVLEQRSLLGAAIALDLHKTKSVSVRFTHNDTLISQYGDKNIVIAEDKNKVRQILSPSNDTQSGIIGVIVRYLNEHQVVITEAPPHEIFTGRWLETGTPDMTDLINERKHNAILKEIKLKGDVIFQVDLETALRFSLREITRTKTITGERLEVLQSYTTVLALYFPFKSDGISFLKQLSLTNDTASIRRIVKNAINESSQVFSTQQEWFGCRGSSEEYRGYPCGLWKLFHYLTINAAEKKRHSSNSDPLEILRVMHGYVKYFFGCHDCSQHFQQMASETGMWNVSSPDSAVLWLWKAHNRVNARLAGDKTEDPEFPKVQFPSKEKCHDCHYGNDSWNEDRVLIYLDHIYNKQRLNSNEYGTSSVQSPMLASNLILSVVIFHTCR